MSWLDAFDYPLPPDRIALRPAEPRESARMLVVRWQEGWESLEDRRVGDLPQILREGDVLVLNDTRVVPTQLSGIRHRGNGAGTLRTPVEITLHKRQDEVRWRAFARPGRRLAAGDRVQFGSDADALWATVEQRHAEGDVTLAFDGDGPALDRGLLQHGRMPLPPYIAQKRPADARDRADYQTVYARRDGAVAAPTAGLHLTVPLLDALASRGVETVALTLHVGAGTFLPVKAERPDQHRIHAEWGRVPEDTAARLNAARASGRRIIAVGTTAARLLETVVDDHGHFHAFEGETAIFIQPGHIFRGVDGLMTNFHLPRSTLVMMIAAFMGHARQRRSYEHAIAQVYRFYSYGDAMLLLPGPADP